MRKWLTALLTAAMLLAAAPPVRAAGPDIAAPSAILMDAATGTVLYEKNASERLRPASVTKVMTLLLVMEALDTGRIGWKRHRHRLGGRLRQGWQPGLSGAGRGDEHGRNAQIRRRKLRKTTAPRRWRSMWRAARARSSA